MEVISETVGEEITEDLMSEEKERCNAEQDLQLVADMNQEANQAMGLEEPVTEEPEDDEVDEPQPESSFEM